MRKFSALLGSGFRSRFGPDLSINESLKITPGRAELSMFLARVGGIMLE